jgi:transposase
MRAEGKTPPEIAAILNRHVETVRTWIKLYNEGGLSRLEYKHSGGAAGKLAREQEESLAGWLKERRPDGQKWTLSGLAARLQEEYGVKLSQQQISKRIMQWELGHLISRPRRKKAHTETED